MIQLNIVYIPSRSESREQLLNFQHRDNTAASLPKRAKSPQFFAFSIQWQGIDASLENKHVIVYHYPAVESIRILQCVLEFHGKYLYCITSAAEKSPFRSLDISYDVCS